MTNMYLRKWSIASCCCSSWLVRWAISKENVWQRGIPGICVPVRWWSISTTDLENKRKLLCPFHLETDQCTHWYKWNYTRASAINLNPLPFEKQIIICIWPSANPGDQKAKPSFKGQNLLSWFQSPGHDGWWRGLNTHLFSWLFSANLLPVICNKRMNHLRTAKPFYSSCSKGVKWAISSLIHTGSLYFEWPSESVRWEDPFLFLTQLWKGKEARITTVKVTESGSVLT